MTTDPVAVIGVGAMGKALLTRLRMLGKTVVAYDPAPAAQAAIAACGAAAAPSAAAAAHGAGVIHVIVASDGQAAAAILPPDGVLGGASSGALILLHSTVLPDTTLRLAEAAARTGVGLIDAPTSAVPQELAAGKGAFLVGGPAALVERARGHLLQLGDGLHHLGPLGAGNVAKLAQALINAGCRVVVSEALALVEAGGIDPRQFLELERATGTPAPASRWEHIFTIADGHASHRPSTNLFRKDIMLAAELAESFGLSAPLAKGTAETAVEWVRAWSRAPKG